MHFYGGGRGLAVCKKFMRSLGMKPMFRALGSLWGILTNKGRVKFEKKGKTLAVEREEEVCELIIWIEILCGKFFVFSYDRVKAWKLVQEVFHQLYHRETEKPLETACASILECSPCRLSLNSNHPVQTGKLFHWGCSSISSIISSHNFQIKF